MKNTLKIDKVSELELYLTLQAYRSFMQKAFGCRQGYSSSLTAPISLDAFRSFYENIHPPIIWAKEQCIGFVAPFSECFVLNPGETVEIPIGFSIQGDYSWVQPATNKFLFTSKKIGGESNAKGTLLAVTNITAVPQNYVITKNNSFCMLKINDSEKQTQDITGLLNIILKKKEVPPAKFELTLPVFYEEHGLIKETTVSLDYESAERILSNYKRLTEDLF